MKLKSLVLLAAVAFGMTAAGAENGLGMSCLMNGRSEVFEGKAVLSADGAVQLIGQASPFAFLAITVPKAKLGVQRSADTPGLILHFTSNASSSDSRTYYDARPELPGTSVEVNLTDLGAATGILAGEFSAEAVNSPATGKLQISKGQFRLKVTRPVIKAEQNKGLPPGANATPGVPGPKTNGTPPARGPGR